MNLSQGAYLEANFCEKIRQASKQASKQASNALFAIFLSAAFLLTIFCQLSFAADKTITKGVSVLKGAQETNVWFGTYQQGAYSPAAPPASPVDKQVYQDGDTRYYYNGGGNYYEISPVKWRVLSTTPNGKQPNAAESYDDDEYEALNSWGYGDGVLLFSDKNLDIVQYNEANGDITWEKCTLRSWLNGYAADYNNVGKDCSGTLYGNSFFISALSSVEREALLATVLSSDFYHNDKGITGGNNTKDKIFALSYHELTTTSYGFGSDATITTNRGADDTAYAAAGGNTGKRPGVFGQFGVYWTRTPGSGGQNTVCQVVNGGISEKSTSTDDEADYDGVAVRPGLNVNAKQVIFTTAAEGVKSAVFAPVDDLGANITDFKFTLSADGEMTGEVTQGATLLAQGYGGETLTISHDALETLSALSYDRVTAALASGDEILYYGAINTDASATASSVAIPAGLPVGNYELLIYAEQQNGNYRSDYATGKALKIPIGVYPLTFSLDKYETTIEERAFVDVNVIDVTPPDAANKKIIWNADGGSVIEIVTFDDAHIEIKGLKTGQAVVTATAEDGGYFRQCVVTVTEKVAPVPVPTPDNPTPAPDEPTPTPPSTPSAYDKTTDCYVETGGCDAIGLNALVASVLLAFTPIARQRKK